MRHGRPLRFLVVLMGGWTTVRVALLWPGIETAPDLIRAIVPPVAATPLPMPLPMRAPAPRVAAARPTRHRPAREPAPIVMAARLAATQPAARRWEAAPERPSATAASDITHTPAQPPPLRPAPLATPPGRIAGSVWGIVRDGGGDLLSGGQLGGSQVGARLTYALGRARRVAIAARVVAPLDGGGGDLGVGIDWQPIALPLHLIAEQRVALGGARGGRRGGPTLMAVAGVDPRPLAAGFRLEAYAQAGAIARGRVEGFADGAARVIRPVAQGGGVRLDLGIGAWGGAQRAVARVDVGPTLAVVLPVERRAVRVTLDWRQRIAGNARPGSGLALSIGGDF